MAIKPPLGIEPIKFWLETRRTNLYDAIGRRQEFYGGFCSDFVNDNLVGMWLDEAHMIEKMLIVLFHGGKIRISP
jgi:hypothetical protein